MLTRRALLASAAVSPLLAAGLPSARSQVQTPGEEALATPVGTPQEQAVADLTGRGHSTAVTSVDDAVLMLV
jgi:hypothetical protein